MKGILIDLDGAIFQGDHLIDGADKLITKLQEQKFPHLFLTNSSAYPRKAIVDKLAGFGISVQPQEIMTPAVAAAQWLCEHNVERLAVLLPRETAEDLVGFELVSMSGDESAEAVVIGDLGKNWNYTKLNHAFRRLVEEPHPKLVALGMTRYWYTEEKGLNLDVAPFVKALEFASGCEAEVIGKPSQTFFEEGLHILGCDASECIMIGDDIHADVKGAQDANLKAVLVKTGKFRERDLHLGITPDIIIESIAELDDILSW